MDGQRLSVFCTGFEDVSGHVEYVFQVLHSSGCNWKTQRRYSDLLLAHQALDCQFDGLPDFPPKSLPGIGALLGQEFSAQRASALQRYYEAVLARQSVCYARDLQRALGVQRPSAVSSVRVSRWLLASPEEEGVEGIEKSSNAGPPGTAMVEFDVKIGHSVACAPVDELVAVVKIYAGRTTTVRILYPQSALSISGLPCGELIDVEVHACNGIGESDPFLMCLQVPGRQRKPLYPGTRVQAVYAGDGKRYDASVKSITADGSVLVNWLRPAPLSAEILTCVCEHGGEDTDHRVVPRARVWPLAEDIGLTCLPILGYDADSDQSTAADSNCESAEETPKSNEFHLSVRLNDNEVAELTWPLDEPPDLQIAEFMTKHRLQPELVRKGLMSHAELMIDAGCGKNMIDILDLT